MKEFTTTTTDGFFLRGVINLIEPLTVFGERLRSEPSTRVHSCLHRCRINFLSARRQAARKSNPGLWHSSGGWELGKDKSKGVTWTIRRVGALQKDKRGHNHGLVVSWMRACIPGDDVRAHSQALCAWLLEEDKPGTGKAD